MRGSLLMSAMPAHAGPAREAAILAAQEHWVQPTWVEVALPPLDGHTGSVFVANDYFAIGEPGDTVRVPVDAYTAQSICDAMGARQPTAKLVDLIWRAATVRPEAITGGEIGIVIGGAEQMSTQACLAHSMAIDAQLLQLTATDGLVAGHKKDICLTEKLVVKPASVAIYGWWRRGAPIQPLSTFHEGTYTDYSHGLRLVQATMRFDGRLVPVADILRSQYASMLTYEGPSTILRQPPRHVAATAPTSPPPPPTPTPTLRLGSRGTAVLTWCRILVASGENIAPGEVFGAAVDAATRAFQVAQHLTVDGVVGPKTWAAGAKFRSPAPPVDAPPEPTSTNVGELDGVPYKYVQARNYYNANDTTPADLLVLHSMEWAERNDTAESCARDFAVTTRDASGHYCIDSNSYVQCLSEDDAAYAAPGTNRVGGHRIGIHLEHAGFARQTPEEWSDAYSTSMLSLSARLAAQICARHGIPVRFVDAEGLLAGERGITTHAEVTRACRAANQRRLVGNVFYNRANPSRPRTDHTDPGVGFDVAHYVAMVAACAAP